jgi:hypothetical protein
MFQTLLEHKGNVPTTRMITKQKIVTALKDTCVELEERKTQFKLIIQSLERRDAAAENKLEEE